MYTTMELTKSGSLFSMMSTILMLREEGYTFDFRKEPDCIYCLELGVWIMPHEFNIDRCFHFEEVGFPDEDRVLLAISAFENVKGLLVDTFGVYSDNTSVELARKFEKHKL